MDNYHLKISAKTKIFNALRQVFTISVLEKALIASIKGKPSSFLRKLIPPDYLYKNGTYRVVQRNGINYKLDISNVVDHFIYFEIDDPGFLSIKDTVKGAKVILDIGANIGSTALYFASLNTNAKILAFEPHPDTFKRATENIKLNDFKNIDLINLGLGEEKAQLRLYQVNEHNPGMNRIIAEDRDLPYKIIEVDILDKILDERNISKVDFIKLDVEGFEYSVLAGAANTLKSHPVLFIELDDNNLKENNRSAKELIDLLSSAGYKQFLRADNMSEIDKKQNFDNCHYDIIVK
ncbi:MAG: FkbM family methyltransferase [Chitinophagaceae bacterium]|jgi:FkbM family methyltransferase